MKKYTTQQKYQKKRIRDTLGVPVAPVRMEAEDNEEQDHIDSPMNNNDDNYISNAPCVKISIIEPARQYDFDYDCVVDYFKLLKIHSDKPTPTDVDGILQHHKNYHCSSMLGEEPNFVLKRVMGEKMNASK